MCYIDVYNIYCTNKCIYLCVYIHIYIHIYHVYVCAAKSLQLCPTL